LYYKIEVEQYISSIKPSSIHRCLSSLSTFASSEVLCVVWTPLEQTEDNCLVILHTQGGVKSKCLRL